MLSSAIMSQTNTILPAAQTNSTSELESEAESESRADLALETKNLVKEFKIRTGMFSTRLKVAVNKVNLTVPRGTVYGFLGKNGAGKTTTIKMILGLNKTTSGEIRILGESSENIQIRERLGFSPEKPAFYPHLTGWEVLHYVGQLSGLDSNAIRERGGRLLELVSLHQDGNRLVKDYSKGMQQRLGLIQALLNSPDLVIFDEPATGLDPFGRRLVKDLILGMKEEGRTVFFSSHQLLDVQEVCDRVGIIHHGRLIIETTVDELVPAGQNLEEKFVEMITKIDQELGHVSTID